MRSRPFGLFAATLLVATWNTIAAGASAQRANYNDVLVGGRASGMGGAFTAVASDSSAVYHNPAGIAQIRKHDVSLSVSAYGFLRSIVDKRLGAGSANEQMTLDSVLVFPSATAWVMPLGAGERWNHSLALAALVPEFFEYEGVSHLDADNPDVEFTTVDETGAAGTGGFRFNSYIDLTEISEPATPAANTARIRTSSTRARGGPSKPSRFSTRTP